MRSVLEREELSKEIGDAKAMDPVLGRRGCSYGQFLAELRKRGVIEMTDDESESCRLLREAGLAATIDLRRKGAHRFLSGAAVGQPLVKRGTGGT